MHALELLLYIPRDLEQHMSVVRRRKEKGEKKNLTIPMVKVENMDRFWKIVAKKYNWVSFILS